jgi:hypothetical protein
MRSPRIAHPRKRGLIRFRSYDLKTSIDQFPMSTASACPMNPATVDDLSMCSNSVSSGSWRTAQSVCQGVMMSVVPLFAFSRAVVLLGPRAAMTALMPVTAALLAIPVLGEWPSWPTAAAICVIALGVVSAAASANQGNKKGENQ